VARSLLWTSLALQDLIEIKEFIQRDKTLAAQNEATRIKKSVERLIRFPHSGRVLRTIPNIRELVTGNYRIFYRVRGKQVEILRIYHGKRKEVAIL
jgi:toxin ParE1/3/4